MPGLPLAALAAAGCCVAPHAWAADFTVLPGQTVGPQRLTEPGDFGTIQPGGGVSAAGVSAVRMTNNDQTVDNGGAIGTTGDFAEDIDSLGADAQIGNSGSISATGEDAGGIRLKGPNGQVVNSRRVVSLQANAIQFASAEDDVLTLLPGSVLEGGLVFGGGTDTLVIGNGLAIAATFDKVPEVIDTNGALFAVEGTTVAVVDPTGFSAIDNAVSDMTGGIFGAVASRLDGSSNSIAGLIGYADGVAIRVRPWSRRPVTGGRGASWWFKGFGGYRDLEGSGSTVGAEHAFGGTVMGVDGWVNSDLRLGTYAGLSFGRLEIDHNAQEIDTAGYFAGIYGRYGGHIDFALTGGITDHDSERLVANNLVAGGLETAQADYNGYFIAPEVTVRAGVMMLGPVAVKPSFRARYSYLHLESYDENGSAAGLGVEDRNIHTLDGRFALGVPVIEAPARLLELRAGIDGRVILGDTDVEVSLLGQSLNFDPGGEEGLVGGFVGAHYEERIWTNTSLFISTELGTGTETRLRADAQAGLQITF